MQPLIAPSHYTQLRLGPERRSLRQKKAEFAPLFAPHRPLRSMTIMVDRSLEAAATSDPKLAYLLGLISARDLDISPAEAMFRRYWYDDAGPPPAARHQRYAEAPVSAADWVLVEADDQGIPNGVTYELDDRIMSSIMWTYETVLDSVCQKKPPASYNALPDPHAQMRADLIAVWSARALHADMFVTNRDFLFESPSVGYPRTMVLRPVESLPLIGLYLRLQGQFLTKVSVDGRSKLYTSAASFYGVAALELVPGLWRWRAALEQHSAITQEESLQRLLYTLAHRLGQVISARDRINAALVRPQ